MRHERHGMNVVEAWHGTNAGYARKCRCSECTAAHTAYEKKYQNANREKLARRQAEYRSKNSDKVSAYLAWYREANGEALAAYQVEFRAAGKRRDWQYGLEPGQFDAMLDKQDGKCAVCQESFGDTTPHVDHDHTCCPGRRACGKCIRGLLCGRCNSGLGSFKDDPDRLRLAAQYLGVAR